MANHRRIASSIAGSPIRRRSRAATAARRRRFRSAARGFAERGRAAEAAPRPRLVPGSNFEGVGRPFILDYPIGGGRTAVLVLVLADEGASDLATLIFREPFHAHQRKAFKHPSGSQSVQNGKQAIEMGFTAGSGGMILLGQAHLVLPDPKMAQIALPFAELTVRGRPFMSEGGATGHYTVLVPAAPSVNGRAGLPSGEHRLGRLDLTAEGVKLSVLR